MTNSGERKTSIIIVTYNALDYVTGCIESLRANTAPGHEIIIVDNASDPPTRNYLESLHGLPGFRLILNKENRLWSPANNQGLLASAPDAEFCLLLNSDVKVLRPDWISRLQEPLLAHPRVGISGTQYNFSPVRPTYGAIDGCCFMVRKNLLKEIGLLDERYPWNGAGYVFTVRAWASGYYYYQVDRPKLLIHYGKRSRVSNQLQLQNRKVEKLEIVRDAGLRPGKGYLAYFLNRLGLWHINRRLKHLYT